MLPCASCARICKQLVWYPVVEVVVFVEIDMSLLESIVSLLEFILCGLFSSP